MKKILLLFALFALFAVNKAGAATGDVWTAYVTCIEKDGTSSSVQMLFQIMSENAKYVRIYSDTNDSSAKNSLSTTSREDYYEGCEIIVPEKVGNYTVKAVGKSAFVHCKAKVTLPESVTDIEDMAFRYYEYDGYDFQLPSKVRYIGQFAFNYSTVKCIGLNANLKNIVDYAFSCCKELEELVIPKGIYNIGKGITVSCPKLKRLEVESGCENYSTPAGSNVIMDTKQKTIIAGCSTSRIPEETYRIGERAFIYVSFDNPTLTIPENVGVIGKMAFQGTNVKRLIVRSDNVEIQLQAFFACDNLERIDFYGGNVSIGTSAFEQCHGLQEVYCWSHKPNILPHARQFYDIGPDWQFGDSKVKLYAKYPDEYTDKFVDIWGNETNLVWQNWFEDPVLNISEGESKVIHNIYITDYTWPLGGEDADYTASSLTPHATVSNIKYQMYLGGWKDIDPSPATLGETYSIGFTITLEDGYTFGDEPKLYIDDRAADLRITSSATETQMTFVVDNYVVPAPPGGVPIKSVSITVPDPVEGQPLSTEVTNPTGRKYLAMNWVIDTVYYHPPQGTYYNEPYDPQNTYYLHAVLTAKDGYTFAADGVYKLNGQEARVNSRWTTVGDKHRINLSIVFGNVEPDTTYITTLNLTVAEPVEGEVPVAEVLSPTSSEAKAMGYSIAYSEWIEAGESWDSFEAATEPYDPKQSYPLVIVLYADETSVFVKDMTVTINGLTPEVYLSTNSAGKRTATLVLQYPSKGNKRGDVNGDGNVNTADVVAVYSFIEKGEASGFTRDAANVNGDGNINTADVVAIYDIIINGDNTYGCTDTHHPHMIDLGLPSGTKWACCNVGATNPISSGAFYAWGETEEKSSYIVRNYQHHTSEYVDLGDDIAGTEYDVAHVHSAWGGNWQMPTKEQYEELIYYTRAEWGTIDGVGGLKCTASNGNVLFLPAAGVKGNADWNYNGTYGYYWTSNPYPEDDPGNAYNLFFMDNGRWVGAFNRYQGNQVRAVSKN